MSTQQRPDGPHWGIVLFGTRDKRKLMRILKNQRPWRFWMWLTPEREEAIRFFPFKSRHYRNATIEMLRSLPSHKRHYEVLARRRMRASFAGLDGKQDVDAATGVTKMTVEDKRVSGAALRPTGGMRDPRYYIERGYWVVTNGKGHWQIWDSREEWKAWCLLQNPATIFNPPPPQDAGTA